jgi:anti-sigma factor RsiW
MNPDLHMDTGALAAGAMPPEELAEVEAHLETCESCRSELAGFLETVALLGGAAAEAPPASLRRRVMDLIAVTPQLPPLPAQSESGPPVVHGPGAHRAPEPDAARPDAAGPSGTEPTDPGAFDAGPDATRPVDDTTRPAADPKDEPPGAGPGSVTPLRPRWYRRPGTYLVAAATAAILVVGTVFAVNQFTGEDAVTALRECIQEAPDREQLQPQAGAGGVTLAPSCAGALVDVTGLPPLPRRRRAGGRGTDAAGRHRGRRDERARGRLGGADI